MITAWAGGLARHRIGRLLAAVAGIALAVALVAALGSFLTASKATMTERAVRSVAVDWQVEVQPGADPNTVRSLVQAADGTRAALPVGFARTTGFTATVGGSTQTTGPGVALGLPADYRSHFPDELRTLSGSGNGVLLAQQTASNLHAAPGDTIGVRLPGAGLRQVRVDGVVDLPQADSLFQKVGAPTQSQPTAPPDNVVLLPAARFASLTRGATDVTTQIHVARDAKLPADPAAAFTSVTGAAHHLEAKSAGSALVGDNLGAALDSARQDALYAQILFLFLGVPGAVLAAALTVAVASAGGERRRREQGLLRLRGLRPRQITALAGLEAALVGAVGGLTGLGLAALTGRLAFGAASFGASAGTWAAWYAIAFVLGVAVAAAAVLVPALRDLRTVTVADTRREPRGSRSPWWLRYGLDFALLIGSWLVFRASSGNQYALVLAPEGVPSVSVSYWAFLGPALLWLGAALLLWRLTLLVLAHGQPVLARLARPLTATLATTTAAVLSRRRRTLARSVVLLALAVSFAISTAVFNSTYRQQSEVDARLTNGADVTVTEPPGAHVRPSAADTLKVSGVRHVEPLQHRYAYVGSDLQDLYGVRPATVAKATSLQDAYFSGGTTGQLMRRLAQRPDNLLVSAETVHDFQLSPGDTVNLRIQDARTKALRTVPFHYAGIVKEFPTAPKDSFFVANAAYVAKATGSNAVGAFLLDTGGSHQQQIAAHLRKQLGTGATVTDLTQTRGTVGTSLTSVDLAGLTRIELAFAVLLSAGAGGLVLALGLAERRRTFAVATVLGAKSGQLRGMVLTEALLLAAGGLAGGAVIGWALSEMLVKVLTGVFDPPPASLSVPGGYLALTAGAAVVAVLAAALNGIRSAGRPAVEELRDL
ncbi:MULTISPECIES: FtsX-like permease family protein [Streptomyces]|uniref:Integral membrane protein n=1 Tax=Streptomyces coelicolor (strain ATCC BAA-471 / A3(2) / M145) TaxID=100226 RepID=Q8CJN2_STRCO|nr:MULTISPECIES: FtsX-like permease family protein [Streptomyces]MDX2928626.1 ABC transporter permease [Streptomyces sp. NRRL_B-16638]MDX3369796.1 ABC transporter permease [Streptomyces sp. ME02-6987-2C]MDX3398506.1 ABC transporter permease [Streptomyces sp. ME01-18h]MDX3404665.1 ABC transporter permease [Streptomyces sp. ME02-6977A]MDX3426885.1 ABC transporter permease [Streptomyces sp. ME02-6985-2c]